MKKILNAALVFFIFSSPSLFAQGSNPGTPSPAPTPGIALAAAAGYGLKKARDARNGTPERIWRSNKLFIHLNVITIKGSTLGLWF